MAGQARTRSEVRWDSARFRAALKTRLQNLPPATDAQMAGLAVDISNRAKQLAAVDTGEMRSKIGWRKTGDAYFIFARAGHSVHVEFGTEHMAAQPFMRPAWAEGVSNYARRMRQVRF